MLSFVVAVVTIPVMVVMEAIQMAQTVMIVQMPIRKKRKNEMIEEQKVL